MRWFGGHGQAGDAPGVLKGEIKQHSPGNTAQSPPGSPHAYVDLDAGGLWPRVSETPAQYLCCVPGWLNTAAGTGSRIPVTPIRCGPGPGDLSHGRAQYCSMRAGFSIRFQVLILPFAWLATAAICGLARLSALSTFALLPSCVCLPASQDRCRPARRSPGNYPARRWHRHDQCGA